MGLSVEEQREAQSTRRQPTIANGEDKASGCCQGNGNLSCCQNATIMSKPDTVHSANGKVRKSRSSSSSSGSSSKKKACTMPTWLTEQETYATIAIIAAFVTVAGAYVYLRNRRG